MTSVGRTSQRTLLQLHTKWALSNFNVWKQDRKKHFAGALYHYADSGFALLLCFGFLYLDLWQLILHHRKLSEQIDYSSRLWRWFSTFVNTQ